MGALFSLFTVLILVLIAFAGVKAGNLHFLFGVVIPYAAIITFITGVIYRILKWAGSPVPFRIPTTCGQQKSLPWIKHSKIENPSNTLGVIKRMALEVLLFRSLFRNLKTEIREEKVVYGSEKWLWLAGLVFHWSFLIIILRHFRLFVDPVPAFMHLIESFDGFLQIGVPRLFITGVILLVSVAYLLFRRFFIQQVRYISLANDYFPLFLILGIGFTGILMRYFTKVDLVNTKQLIIGLFSFKPEIPEGVGVIFYIHLFLVSILFAYFPFSKLVHMPGVFLSPTRNLSNNNRTKRHINPWNYPVKVHTYEDYENEFREKMKKAGIPVEKE
ncbi:MAG: sulfate reduction electron transfer complex DsrMKJOP subunit DsrM [Nitrospirota bacterium]|jgi:nitrate reductase gamma subunit